MEKKLPPLKTRARSGEHDGIPNLVGLGAGGPTNLSSDKYAHFTEALDSMPSRVFVDTSAYVALARSNDEHHAKAVSRRLA